jgi:hypothetical protein
MGARADDVRVGRRGIRPAKGAAANRSRWCRYRLRRVFPFADGLEKALAAGITACIQPGGSMRDAEVVAAADKAGIPMVLTAVRHFRH